MNSIDWNFDLLHSPKHFSYSTLISAPFLDFIPFCWSNHYVFIFDQEFYLCFQEALYFIRQCFRYLFTSVDQCSPYQEYSVLCHWVYRYINIPSCRCILLCLIPMLAHRFTPDFPSCIYFPYHDFCNWDSFYLFHFMEKQKDHLFWHCRHF